MKTLRSPSFGPFAGIAVLLLSGGVGCVSQESSQPAAGKGVPTEDGGQDHSSLGPPEDPHRVVPSFFAGVGQARAESGVQECFEAGDFAGMAEEAQALTQRLPDDDWGWRMLAWAEWRLGVAATERGDGTTAQLRLLDAREHAARATDLTPEYRDAWVLRARILKDSSLFPDAVEALGRAVSLGEPDGDLHYDLGYCLAWEGRFEEALDQFKSAEALLGPQARIAVNAAICEEKLGDRSAAVARLRRLYAAEAAAGRAAGADAKWALEKTWDLTVVRRDYDAGRAALEALAAAHPDRPEPVYMLGNLESFVGRQDAAAEAWGRAVAAGAGTAARVKRARALALAGRGEAAAEALRTAMEADPEAEGLAAVALLAADALRTSGKAAEGRSLLGSALEAWPGDEDLLLAAGDAALAEGDLEAAWDLFGRAREESPFSNEAEARVARVRLARVRAGVVVDAEAGDLAASGEPQEPGSASDVLVDFEESGVFLRGEPAGAARVVEGAMRLEVRAGAPPAETPGAAAPGPGADGGWAGRRPARTDFGSLVRVEFFPLLDTRPWEFFVFRARAEGGAATVQVLALDGYDEAGSAFARNRWPAGGEGVAVGAEWGEIAVPLGGMTGSVTGRPLALLRRKVRAFLLAATGSRGGEADAVHFDDLRLRDSSGRESPLADFEDPPAEVAVLYDGTCVPFERTLFTMEDVAGFRVPGTVVYAAHIVGEEFDPALVGEGRASLRLHHGEAAAAPAGRFGKVEGAAAEGASTATVTMNPPRDLVRFEAITFLARGEKGGERLRVRMRDAFDGSGRVPEAARLRPVFPRTATEDGALTLSKEWRLYRIPLDRYPDFNRESAASLLFEFGQDLSNAPDATLWLDSLRLE